LLQQILRCAVLPVGCSRRWLFFRSLRVLLFDARSRVSQPSGGWEAAGVPQGAAVVVEGGETLNEAFVSKLIPECLPGMFLQTADGEE